MDTVALPATSGSPGNLVPLRCARCGAGQPLGDSDVVQCRACGASAPLPNEYRMLRDAKRTSSEDAARLDALVADIARPPTAFQRALIVVGYGVGILTLVVFAIGALVGAVVGLAGAAKLDLDGKAAGVIIVLVALVFGVMSVPFVGEWLTGWATLGGTDAALELATGNEPQWTIDAAVGGILYVFSIVPIAIAWRTSENVSAVKALQSKLSAQPPATPGGACGCRTCGAALDVRPGALAARCVYCGTENLVAVPEAYASKKKEEAGALNKEVGEVMAKHDENRRSDRATMWALLAAGPLLVPILCGAGWVLHAIAGS